MSSGPRIMVIGLVVALSGCATITRGTKEVLVVESKPSGATVTLSTGLTGTTPATFKVSRKGGFVVTIEKEGYETIRVQVSSQVAGGGAAGMAGNIFLGGLIGAAVDAGTGATLQLKPNPIQVELVPIEQPSTPETDSKESKPVSLLIEFEPYSEQLVLLRVSELEGG